ncbi:MAG TPA: tyrosine-type recombinase/integrase [Saprospiraceae bacterium]|nr:tyrosine-type recombinase/integrase [Saprospiraceae bacterium]
MNDNKNVLYFGKYPARADKVTQIKPKKVDVSVWGAQDFLRLVDEMDIKPNSANLYRAGIELYLKWLNGESPIDVTTHQLLEYKEWLKNEKYATSTKNRFLFSVFTMYKVLTRYNCKNIAIGVKAFQNTALTEFKKEPLSKSDWQKILKEIDTSTYSGKKHYLIIFILFVSGVRQMSLRGLKWKDFQYRIKTGFQMKVQLKGSGIREDTVPLNDEACSLLEQFQWEYKRMYCKSKEKGGVLSEIDSDWYVFGIRNKPLSNAGIRKITTTYMKKAGVWVEGKVTPHSFRHGILQHIVEKHGINAAQVLACHRSINSTRIYAGQIEKQKTLNEIRSSLNEISMSEDMENKTINHNISTKNNDKDDSQKFTFMDYF